MSAVPDLSESTNVQAVRAVLGAFATRDLGTFQALIADEFKLEVRPASLKREISNKAEFFETLAGLEHVMAGGIMKFQPIEIIDAPGSNQVVVHANAVDTVSKDGKTPYTNEYLFIVTLKDGKVVHWKEFVDSKFIIEFTAAVQPKA